jgi:hypothetical protein
MEKDTLIGIVAGVSKRRTTLGDEVHQIRVIIASGMEHLLYTQDTRIAGYLQRYSEIATAASGGHSRQKRAKQRGMPLGFRCMGQPRQSSGPDLEVMRIDEAEVSAGTILSYREAPEARARGEVAR